MTLKLIEFPGTGLANVVAGLREIADQIESGEVKAQNITLVTDREVFHLGDVSDLVSIKNAVFNLTMGVHSLNQVWRQL